MTHDWNEANQRFFLMPQQRQRGRGRLELSPAIYRSLVDAAWSALSATGPS